MKLTANAFRQLRFTGVLLLMVVVTAAAGVYWSSFQQQRRYLISRDFRLLTVLANQTENLLDGAARMFQGILGNGPTTSASLEQWVKDARPSVPILRDVKLGEVHATTAKTPSTARFTIMPDAPRTRLRLDLRAVDGDAPVVTVSVSVATLLGPTFTSKLRQGVFDTLVFATRDGRVAFATGKRQQELQSAPLAAVLAPSALAGGKTFPQLALTISVHDAVIAGVNYQVFIQPCCGSVTSPANGKPAAAESGGMIIAGLIESDALHSAALAISPGLVIIGVVLTLLALVVWPFLKLTFLGERQRVTLWDLLQLGACSVFGLALATIVIITADLWVRLNADVDEQLEGLAQELGEHLGREVGFAYGQLSALQQGFSACGLQALPPNGGLVQANVVSAGDINCPGWSITPAPAPASYPDYEAFALIDDSGMQRVKSGPLSWVPSRIEVTGRPYFEAVRSERYWHHLRYCTPPPNQSSGPGAPPLAPGREEGCFLESLWSWTTGQQQAVLSKPGAPFKVAALAFGMRSLIDPVLPPGFEYAIVDDRGAVLFHSDSQRNIHESLFTETDGDRRLRALIAGHGSGAFSTMYWGRGYRAYVESAGIPGWSIVTLSATEGTRALVLEWTAVSLMLLSVYLVCWVIAMLVALRTGASWLWPDLRRRSSYLLLAGVYVALFVIFATVAFFGDSKELLTVGMVIAVAAWAVAFVVLRRRPPAVEREDGRGSRNAASEYALAGALFLVVSGIVPGVAFVVRSYDLHIESYIKHRQLSLARALALRSDSDPARQQKAVGGLAELDRYHSFFYATNVLARERPSSDSHNAERALAHHDFILSTLEEYLPYFSELSVEMRELLHDHADDSTWASSRTAGGALELHFQDSSPGMELVVASTLPRPVPFTSRFAQAPNAHNPGQEPDVHHAERLLIFPYIAPVILIGLGAVAYAIVAFLLRHVYLSSVHEPLWASGRLIATAGDNLLVLCDNSSETADQIDGPNVSRLSLGQILRSEDPAATWTRELMKISSGKRGGAVVIPDLDNELEDLELTHKKVELLVELVNDPERTVLVLSQSPPAMLRDSVRPGQHGPDRTLWTQLLKAFVVLDRRDAPEGPRGTIPVTVETPKVELRGSRGVEDVLKLEGRTDKFVRRICDDIRESKAFRSGFLSREQILDEIEERASSYYQRLWNSCTDDEKVVLGHVAQDGLTNAATRRVVRRLLVRRLLTKDPDLRLMNRTFRNFILSPVIMRQVAQLEGVAEPSTWDRLRTPFALTAAAAGVFLFSTQRDMFNETVTVIAGIGAAVPTVLRGVSALVQRDAGSSSTRSNA